MPAPSACVSCLAPWLATPPVDARPWNTIPAPTRSAFSNNLNPKPSPAPMPRLFLLLAVAFVGYLLLRRIATLPPHRRRGEYFKLALGTAVVGVILLTLAGKMHWVGAALTGLLVVMRQSLPLLLRFFPMLSQWRQQRARAAGSGRSS